MPPESVNWPEKVANAEVPGGVKTNDQPTEYVPSGTWPRFAVTEYGTSGPGPHGGPGFAKSLVMVTFEPTTEVFDTLGTPQLVIPVNVINTLPSAA